VKGVPDGLAMVFQEYGRSLLPWKTVNGNIDLPLRYQKLGADERRRRIDDSLQAVGLSGFGERYPWQLSGGMQQRVAIARALAYQPKLVADGRAIRLASPRPLRHHHRSRHARHR
jgi:NitT/TauT family transport system ATP-binding protein